MHNWLLLTLSSAISLGLYDLCKKSSVRENTVLPVLFWATLAGTTSYCLLLLAQNQLLDAWQCPWTHYGLIWCKSLLVAASWYCGYAALRVLPISLAAPIRATAPLWVFLGGLLLYHEYPNALEGLGMLLIFGGYCALNSLGKIEGFSLKHPGIRFCIAGTLLGACSALLDKFLLNSLHIPSLTVQLHFSIELVIIFAAAWIGRRLLAGPLEPMQWRWSTPITGVLLILSDFTYFHAVGMPDIQISQISLLRRSSCLLTFFLGAWLFKDRNVKSKSLTLAIILLGVVILALAH